MSRNWYKLDTAALIFPATMTGKWCNCYRLSATLNETIDATILQKAVDDLYSRFPFFYVKLCSGLFWYRLEDAECTPTVRQDYAYPLTFMRRSELRHICFRVFFFKNRIAVEFFHSVTDGNGGLVYLKSLLLRYLELRYNLKEQDSGNIPTVRETVPEEESEDSFFKNSGTYAAERSTKKAYRMRGTEEEHGRRHLITGSVPTEKLLEKAHEYKATATEFLTAVMLFSLNAIQKETKPSAKWKPTKVSVPVNLRKLYGSRTLRNFVLPAEVGINPKMGEYSLEELCSSVSHQMKCLATKQNMAGQIASNTQPQKSLPIRLAPLPLKNLIMNAVYAMHGEAGACITISNLGDSGIPKGMQKYIERTDFIIGVQKSYPNNCAVLSYNGTTRINMIRNIKETELERRFFSTLVELGVPVEIESTDR